MGVVTAGEVESVELQCTLEGSDAQDDIEYLWERVGDSLPSSAQVDGGKLCDFYRVRTLSMLLCSSQVY